MIHQNENGFAKKEMISKRTFVKKVGYRKIQIWSSRTFFLDQKNDILDVRSI